MNRRTGPDLWVQILHITTALAWVALLNFQVLWWLAMPEMDTGLVRYLGLDIRTDWLPHFVPWMPLALGVCTLLSLIALILTHYRSRRRLDGPGWNLWLLVILVAGSTWFYWAHIPH